MTISRSTKAGSLYPATLVRGAEELQSIQNRSTKAGSLYPATRLSTPGPAGRGCPLNEGRELIPGDTVAGGFGRGTEAERSTKAGSLYPATRPCAGCFAAKSLGTLNEGRELIPGDTWGRCR